MSADEAGRVAERVARESYGRLVAFLAARTRDVAGAEDALSEAFSAALGRWPVDGIPDNPDAWLLTAARRRQIDDARRKQTRRAGEQHVELIGEELEAMADPPGLIPDRRLALMFACAHPAIDPGLRTPLILQTILGLTADDIAAAFLTPPKTMGQRLVRAKIRLRDAGVPFRVPDQEELPERLAAVLDAIYAAYTKGWNEIGDQATPELAEEAIWLGRLVVSLLPDEPEAKGMLALMLYTAARRAARRDATGAYVPLERQDTTLWDHPLLAFAETLLRQASAAGPSGRYQIEAAIQSAHVARRQTGKANWPAVVALYDHLLALTDSPVVLLNRAVARAEVDGPRAGLAELASIEADLRMRSYQPYWAAKGQLHARGRRAARPRSAERRRRSHHRRRREGVLVETGRLVESDRRGDQTSRALSPAPAPTPSRIGEERYHSAQRGLGTRRLATTRLHATASRSSPAPVFERRTHDGPHPRRARRHGCCTGFPRRSS